MKLTAELRDQLHKLDEKAVGLSVDGNLDWTQDDAGVYLRELYNRVQRAHLQVNDQRDNCVVVDSRAGPMSHDANFTMADGTPIGWMVTKAQLDMEAGKPHKLRMELNTADVLAQVMDYQLVLNMEKQLAAIKGMLESTKVGDVEKMATAAKTLLADMQGQLDVAKALMQEPSQVLHGRTLQQWCEVFGIEDQELIQQAQQLNKDRHGGVRVFPDGPTDWMAVGPDYHRNCGPEAQVAFGETPELALKAWADQYERAADSPAAGPLS